MLYTFVGKESAPPVIVVEQVQFKEGIEIRGLSLTIQAITIAD